MVGPTPAELESLNELIKFDHIYYKEEPHKALLGSDADSSSNSVTSNLLPSGHVLPTLAPKSLRTVRPSLAPVTTGSVLVVSSAASPVSVPAVTVTSAWSSNGTCLLAPATMASVTKMVDPNAVCGRVSVTVRNELANKKACLTSQMLNDGHFDASSELLDFESLLGLTDLELPSSFQLQDQTSHPPASLQQQHTVKTNIDPLAHAATSTVNNTGGCMQKVAKGPTHQSAQSSSRKRKQTSTLQDSSQDTFSFVTSSPVYSSSPVYGLDVSELTYCEDPYQGSVSDSGVSGDLSDAPSPGSDRSSVFEDEDWQSSFTELFPSLL